MMGKMVQYSMWSNCSNHCDFCLIRDHHHYTKKEQIANIRRIRENIKHVDWQNEFSYGISLLGGELYFITDKEVQDEFMLLIDDIIENILLKVDNKFCRYSSVTNGLYEPSFLFRVIDEIKNRAGIEKVDINFSYDLKYRYHSEARRKLALENINKFHNRYDYRVGVQMIVTQHLINLCKSGEFNVAEFVEKEIPGCVLSLLYPHPVQTGNVLPDFFFTRDDLFWFVNYLRENCLDTYYNFLYSTKNSGTFKYTGFLDRSSKGIKQLDQQPTLSDGKEELSECGHSVLYKCYSDSDECMLCDLELLEADINS